MTTQPRQGSFGSPRRALRPRLLLAGLLGLAGLSGCQETGFFTPKAPPPPAESFTVRGDDLVPDKAPKKDSPEARLRGAHEYFRQGDFDKAADLFHSLRDKKRSSEEVFIEATFYEAECYRRQSRYPKAADTYSALQKAFPNNPYREQVAQHLYTIADYWLEDTRNRMRQTREKRAGDRWFVDSTFVNFDKTKPFAFEEDRAVEKLELVHLSDINGSLGLGDKALFTAGAVKFFNEDYDEADHFLSQVHQNYPNSKMAPMALELAIISKTLSMGGPDYDARKLAEARQLIDVALRSYPELAAQKEQFLTSKLDGITALQAAKDLKTAEFYERRQEYPSAWFYYEMVERRYPRTREAGVAAQSREKLRATLEKQGKKLPVVDGDAVTTPKVEPKAPPPRVLPEDVGPPPGPLPAIEPGRPLR